MPPPGKHRKRFFTYCTCRCSSDMNEFRVDCDENSNTTYNSHDRCREPKEVRSHLLWAAYAVTWSWTQTRVRSTSPCPRKKMLCTRVSRSRIEWRRSSVSSSKCPVRLWLRIEDSWTAHQPTSSRSTPRIEVSVWIVVMVVARSWVLRPRRSWTVLCLRLDRLWRRRNRRLGPRPRWTGMGRDERAVCVCVCVSVCVIVCDWASDCEDDPEVEIYESSDHSLCI